MEDKLSPAASGIAPKQIDETVIPIIEEDVVISKRAVDTGIVRLHKHTEEWIEQIDVPLTRVEWHVDRVPINRIVQERPDIRHEGETTVYPVVEERVTVLRELVLVEEVRVTRSTITTVETVDSVLKRERLIEERIPVEDSRAAKG